MTTNGL